MDKKISRKDFIKKTSIAGAGLAAMPFSVLRGIDDRKVNVAFIGVGARGIGHVSGIAARSDVEITAICDIDKENAHKAQKVVKDAGMPAPELYTRGERDYQRMLERDDIDGVVISTPWLWHVPMATDAMKAGKYVGIEVPAATTVDGCWELVETSEETGSPCMLMENVCFRRDVMAILNMVRKGLFGEMIHARCGYQHNLQPILINDKGDFGPGTESESKWRTDHHVNRNADLYPTHGIGPVSHWLDINRGNRFMTITSYASKARGLHSRIVETGGENHPNADINFKKGDVVTSLIETANDETIVVTHDTSLPRPYSLGFRCQGTKGIWMVDNDSIYLEGISPKYDRWEPFGPYQKKYDSVLWKQHEKDAEGAGHGGMDYFVRNAFVESIKRKVTPPIDVYDAAAWSVISPLSEESIARGGDAVEFPDFTDGKWMTNERIFNVTGEY